MSVVYKKESGGVDLIKLTGSILVVMIHTRPFAGSALDYYVFSLCTIGVPYFFVISSYYFFRNGQNRKYFRRIIQLYATWFIIEIPIVWYRFFYNAEHVDNNIAHFIFSFFTGSTFPVSWYLMASFEGVLFVYILRHKLNNMHLLFIGIVSYGLCLFSSSYAFLTDNSFWNVIIHKITFGNSVFVGLIYIILGKILAEHANITETVKSWHLIAFLSLWFMEICILKGDFVNTGCFIILPFVAICLSALSLKSVVDLKENISLFMRKSSTLVYLFHPVAIFVLTHLFHLNFGIHLFLFTMMASFIFACVVYFFAGKYRILRLLY